MMRRYVSSNVAFLFLVIISTIDTSRIFHLPLPKIHSTHHETKTLPIAQESIKQVPREKKSIRGEFIPLSAMERFMYENDDDDDEKRDFIDWDSLLDKKARHHIAVNEHGYEKQRQLEDLIASNRNIQRLNEANLHDDTDADIDKLSSMDQKHVVDESRAMDAAVARAERLQSNDELEENERNKRRNDVLFLAIVGTCSLVGILGLVAAAIFWYKIQKRAEAALDAEYPAYGVTGPGGSSGSKISPSATISDRKLAQSAQMFHYQQQRQQMMAQEKAHLDAKPVHSDDSDDEAPNGGDYTVYECPGLAPTGEMEVRNPLFSEPDSPGFASHPTTNNHYPQPTTSSPSSSSPPKERSLS